MRRLFHGKKTLGVARKLPLFFLAALAALALAAGSRWMKYSWFATREPIFVASDVRAKAPDQLLTDRFTCTHVVLACVGDTGGLVLFILSLETAGLLVLLSSGLRTHKRKRVSFLVFLQVIIIIGWKSLDIIPPYLTKTLADQAKKETITAAEVIDNPEDRRKLGIIDAAEELKAFLADHPTIPYYYEYFPKAEAALQVLRVDHEKKDTLYRAVILPRAAYKTFPVATAPFELLYFPNNTLIVAKPSLDTLKALTPTIAITLLKHRYTSNIKSKEPTITMLAEAQYNTVMHKKAEERKQEILGVMSEIRAAIAELTREIAFLNAIKDRSPYKAEIEADIALGNKYLANYRYVLSTYEEGLASFEKAPITPEMQAGVFTPPNDIYVKYYEKEDVPFSSYLATMVHEYLHYEDGGNRHEFPAFLEEGVTDYLTSRELQAFIAHQGTVAHIPPYEGYVNFIKIVSLLREKISEDELLKVYFVRDEDGLRKLVDERFGKDTYDQLKTKGDQLYYLGDKKEGHDELMKEIETLLTPKK